MCRATDAGTVSDRAQRRPLFSYESGEAATIPVRTDPANSRALPRTVLLVSVAPVEGTYPSRNAPGGAGGGFRGSPASDTNLIPSKREAGGAVIAATIALPHAG